MIDKSKIYMTIMGLGIVGVGILTYSVNSFSARLNSNEKGLDAKSNASDLVSAEDARRMSVTINNNYNPSNKAQPQPTQQLTMQQPQAPLAPQTPQSNAANAKPKFLYAGNNQNSDGNASGNAANQPNSISQTDTSIGTGVVDTQMKAQSSPYTLFAGSPIPITMQSGMNSDQRGQVIASVSRDVYDTTTGQYLLIPQGSTVIGTYDNKVAYAQNSLMVGWNRIIYPNGTSILLHGQPGTNLAGYSGFDGSVDNHYLKIYGGAGIIGLIMGANAVAMGNQGELTQPTAGMTMAQMVGAQMGQTGMSVIQRGLNVPPTIIINKGFRAYIVPTADLVLKPYVFKGDN